jgi:voltage-gated potassium channel
VLRKAGIMRAAALVAAINTDAENVYVTLSARALRPGPCHRRPRPH